MDISRTIIYVVEYPLYIFLVKYAKGIQITFRYENTGTSDAPFGYGLHPFWKVGGTRKDTAICVPCKYIMDLANLVPTGTIQPVEGTKLDLRKPTSLEGVDIDNLFWDRDKKTDACIEGRFQGIELKEPTDHPAVGFVTLTAIPHVEPGEERPQATVMLGYEFMVSAKIAGEAVGSAKLRLTPGTVPNIRLRATPVSTLNRSVTSAHSVGSSVSSPRSV